MILVHAGNRVDAPDRPSPRFPASQVADVSARVRLVLTSLAPAVVVSAPAAGADLIVLYAAQQLDIPVHIIVPIDVDSFVDASVADHGLDWVSRFHDVMTSASDNVADVVVQLNLDPASAWWFAANGELIDAADDRADPGETVVALTIRPMGGEEPPSVTDDFARRAHDAGLLVLTLDPLAPNTTVTGTRRDGRG